jgi:hypothetical protein
VNFETIWLPEAINGALIYATAETIPVIVSNLSVNSFLSEAVESF